MCTVDEIKTVKMVTMGEIAAKLCEVLEIPAYAAYKRVGRACASGELKARKIGKQDVRIEETHAVAWIKQYLKGVPYGE